MSVTVSNQRVLMLISELGYGGAESAFLRLAEHLSRKASVTIAVLSRAYARDDYTPAEISTDLPIIVLGHQLPSTRWIGRKALRWFRLIRRIRELRRETDVSISFLSGPNLLNALAGPSGGTILSERGSKRFDDGMPWFTRMLWTRVLDPIAYRRARFVVAASNGLASEISSANPAIAPRVLAIEGLIDTDKLTAQAAEPCEPEFAAFRSYPTVVAYGRMHHQKGFDSLLTVFARVKLQSPNARLLLIGDGPKLYDYLALSRSLGLRSGTEIRPDDLDVVFAGYRAAPLRYLDMASVFVLTSRYEGLPNALIEALVTGIPILAADCPWGPRSVLSGPGDKEQISDRDLPVELTYGTLMPSLDAKGGPDAWVTALLERLDAPRQRRSIEESKAAVSRFDIETTGPEWTKLICASLDEGKGGAHALSRGGDA